VYTPLGVGVPVGVAHAHGDGGGGWPGYTSGHLLDACFLSIFMSIFGLTAIQAQHQQADERVQGCSVSLDCNFFLPLLLLICSVVTAIQAQQDQVDQRF
jgi:hypothetical protein